MWIGIWEAMMTQVIHSPPSPDALQSARLVRLFGRFSKPTAPSSTAVLLELTGRTRGVLERWKKGEDRLAGGRWTRALARTGTPALLQLVGFNT